MNNWKLFWCRPHSDVVKFYSIPDWKEGPKCSDLLAPLQLPGLQTTSHKQRESILYGYFLVQHNPPCAQDLLESYYIHTFLCLTFNRIFNPCSWSQSRKRICPLPWPCPFPALHKLFQNPRLLPVLTPTLTNMSLSIYTISHSSISVVWNW